MSSVEPEASRADRQTSGPEGAPIGLACRSASAALFPRLHAYAPRMPSKISAAISYRPNGGMR